MLITEIFLFSSCDLDVRNNAKFVHALQGNYGIYGLNYIVCVPSGILNTPYVNKPRSQ
jgi:hypothetical protein